MSGIEPFRIAISDEDLTDLRARLHGTRWAETWADPQWAYGVDPAFLRDLCRYWADEYDWRYHEAQLNQFPQYRTHIDGAQLHFLHVRSPEPDADATGDDAWLAGLGRGVRQGAWSADRSGRPRRQPEDAFHVVCPRSRATAFRDRPLVPDGTPAVSPGPWPNSWDSSATSATALRAETGERQLPCGWATLPPSTCVGVHINTVATSPDAPDAFDDLTPEEEQALDRVRRYMAEGAGYGAIQSTRPNTVGVGLDDSPAGLCAWIVDKFWDWSDHGGDVLRSFTRDELLTDVSIYWFTRTATSAGRLYYEAAHAGSTAYQIPRLEVPTGCAIFPAEIARPLDAGPSFATTSCTMNVSNAAVTSRPTRPPTCSSMTFVPSSAACVRRRDQKINRIPNDR